MSAENPGVGWDWSRDPAPASPSCILGGSVGTAQLRAGLAGGFGGVRESAPTLSSFSLQGPSLPGPPVSVGAVGSGTLLRVVLEELKSHQALKGGVLGLSSSHLVNVYLLLRGFQAKLGFLERLEHWDPR